MDLRDLQAFLAVAEELHFGRAAERLHMAQPPLSSRIRRMERETGLDLFERSTRSCRLTDAGERLLPAVRSALRGFDAVTETAQALAAGDLGRVRIGFAGASSQRSLPRLTSAVRRAHPGIELVLRSQTYVYSAFEMLTSGELDLAFVRLPVGRRGLSHRVVEVERLLCALPEGHRLAGQEAINLGDLVDDDFVALRDDQGSMLQARMISACVEAGFRPRIVQRAPDSSTVLALVAAGAGVTITLSSVSQAQTVGLVYRPVIGLADDRMHAALAWRTDDDSPSLRAVLQVGLTALPTPDPDASGMDGA
ncbi:LysR family transcriptional regulator [Klenkia taihuensis]|uniref:DNA-binding transcriptional regulator, LysR family n=1 Tax=Klenkia taihuensis TaxID=1225127 RepID=A0A1I1U901_9ACTN|nr:LysR family transcriptional regulator [Klenkia taihuensis]GHE07003.1 LysR family transcriptional regulator [Klenkia taihuensis]SFD64400.1 DNA-binding transcriptional regulator, LysR family [Klenkia taihuensis]